jgi:hypothetical protein
LGTPTSLWALLHSRRFGNIFNSFAALKGLAPDQVSSLASVIIAVAVKNPNLIRVHFPEILFDPALTAIVESRT